MLKFAYSIILLILVIYFTPSQSSAQNVRLKSGHTEGDSIISVTLFAPVGQQTTYLIDDDGNRIHTWQSAKEPAISAYMLQDSSLLRTTKGKIDNTIFGAEGGAGGTVERLNWEGDKIWEFNYNSENHLLHHDIEYMPNGNVLMISWDRMSKEEALAAGRDSSLLKDDELWPDKIIEVEPTDSLGGNIVWEWRVRDHLIQDFDSTKANYGVVSNHPEKIDINFVNNKASADMNHCNAVDYNAELDQIIITSKVFSEIWIINHNTTTEEAAGSAGDLLYRWGNPQTYKRGTVNDQKLFGPHDGHWIEKGLPGEDDILIFNNGKGRADGDYSSIDQITPPLNDLLKYNIEDNMAYGPDTCTWTYQSSPATKFYSVRISGSQRLPDGNTLICEGIKGNFFEVTEQGQTVWTYTNPYTSTTPDGSILRSVFRAYRYYLVQKNDPPTSVLQPQIPSSVLDVTSFPNPFTNSTTIEFNIKKPGQVKINIYNLQGQLISTLIDGYMNSGKHKADWNATNNSGIKLPHGTYIFQVRTDAAQVTGKINYTK